jgi:mannose-6-phosphate isomerase-like protein (cupin superfamily)
MNDPHKFGTEFGSDDAPEHSAAIVSRHDSIKWFEAIPGEQLCIRVHGTQVNGRYAIMENIAAPGTATPMHFHAEDEIFHVLEGTVTFSIDGDVSMRPSAQLWLFQQAHITRGGIVRTLRSAC